MEIKVQTQDLDLYYGDNHALKKANIDIYENSSEPLG